MPLPFAQNSPTARILPGEHPSDFTIVKRILLDESDLELLIEALNIWVGAFEVPPTEARLKEFSSVMRLRERLYRVQEDNKHVSFKL